MTTTPIAEQFAAIAARLAEIKPQPQPQPNKPLPSLQEIADRIEAEKLQHAYLSRGHV